MHPFSPALAVIDGSLSQLTREGAAARSCAPLATAVVEFRGGPLCVYVRELPHGLLPGMPNLYCLDGDLRMMWMAEWPEACGYCTRINDASGDVLTAESASGAIVRLDAHTGKIIGIDQPMAVAG
ncbi:MAG TPA: hypothetical protein VL069_02805 [Opitutus sp.]|nr:hypothetical protein [Opitutus sp.]